MKAGNEGMKWEEKWQMGVRFSFSRGKVTLDETFELMDWL
jgi:hypothetical protein